MYKNYGDVNPLDHGGIWVKEISKNEFEIIKNYPEEEMILNLTVNISDEWIEKESVMSFIGMEEFDPVWFAIGCTDYYAFANFGTVYDNMNQEETIKFLKARGITP